MPPTFHWCANEGEAEASPHGKESLEDHEPITNLLHPGIAREQPFVEEENGELRENIISIIRL